VGILNKALNTHQKIPEETAHQPLRERAGLSLPLLTLCRTQRNPRSQAEVTTTSFSAGAERIVCTYLMLTLAAQDGTDVPIQMKSR
jgi:hypothetical protein